MLFELIFGGLIVFLLWRILDVLNQTSPDKNKITPEFSAVILPENLIFRGINKMELKEGQKATLTVALRTATGHAAGYETGTAQFESSDDALLKVTSNPDNELLATIETLDGSNNDTATVTFRADGLQGDGEREIVGTLAVVCTQGDATVVEITATPPPDDDGTNPPVAGGGGTATGGDGGAGGTASGGATGNNPATESSEPVDTGNAPPV